MVCGLGCKIASNGATYRHAIDATRVHQVRNNESVYGDEMTPARYKELSGVSKREYEQRLLRAVQESLPRGASLRADQGQVESVTLAGAGEETKIVVIFRVANRGLHRLFGWRIAIWPASDPTEWMTATPEDYASLFPMYLDEAINTIPFHTQIQAPDNEGIEWVEEG